MILNILQSLRMIMNQNFRQLVVNKEGMCNFFFQRFNRHYTKVSLGTFGRKIQKRVLQIVDKWHGNTIRRFLSTLYATPIFEVDESCRPYHTIIKIIFSLA